MEDVRQWWQVGGGRGEMSREEEMNLFQVHLKGVLCAGMSKSECI